MLHAVYDFILYTMELSLPGGIQTRRDGDCLVTGLGSLWYAGCEDGVVARLQVVGSRVQGLG